MSEAKLLILDISNFVLSGKTLIVLNGLVIFY